MFLFRDNFKTTFHHALITCCNASGIHLILVKVTKAKWPRINQWRFLFSWVAPPVDHHRKFSDRSSSVYRCIEVYRFWLYFSNRLHTQHSEWNHYLRKSEIDRIILHGFKAQCSSLMKGKLVFFWKLYFRFSSIIETRFWFNEYWVFVYAINRWALRVSIWSGLLRSLWFSTLKILE